MSKVSDKIKPQLKKSDGRFDIPSTLVRKETKRTWLADNP
jgi:hypothetical protein